jgi:hypothetical protein
MNLLRVVIVGFVVLEATNVVALYSFPGSKYANSVGVFKAWEVSKLQPEVHAFVKYLVDRVAGTKLIFLLLVVILFTADEQGLFLTGVALVVSISTFFWRLFPLIRTMDRASQIDPTNYSAILGFMISAIVMVLVAALSMSGSW